MDSENISLCEVRQTEKYKYKYYMISLIYEITKIIQIIYKTETDSRTHTQNLEKP